MSRHEENRAIAAALDRVGYLLEQRENNVFRVRSYRRAAQVVRDLDRPVAELLEERGIAGLTDLEGIGSRLAGSLQQLAETGRLALLDRLEAKTHPTTVLSRVPGIGKGLANRIHRQLGIETLEDLEQAAHDGRLRSIEGIGEKRIKGIRAALAGMLGRSAAQRARQRHPERTSAGEAQQAPDQDLPSVTTILAVDAEYRSKAGADELHKIAPRRFNPEGVAWLPVMRTNRDGWSFTVLYSNTSQAHELDKTDDWVVLYFARGGTEDQCTVVTEVRGPLKGKRVIRGREDECQRHYEQGEAQDEPSSHDHSYQDMLFSL